MKKIRKSLSVILSLIMLTSLFSVVGFAADDCIHAYSAENLPPTCVEYGYTLYVCSQCGDNYKVNDNNLPPLGHNFGEWYEVDAPSCTVEGHMKRDCSRCTGSEVKTLSILEHADLDSDGVCDSCDFQMEVEDIFSPFDWLVAFFKALREWFAAIFA